MKTNFFLFIKVVAIFTLIRLVLLALFNFGVTALTLNQITWGAVPLESIQTLFGALAHKICFKFIPCDLFFLFFWTAVTFFISVATISYMTNLQPNNNLLICFKTAWQKLRHILIWAIFYSIAYFLMLNTPTPYPIILFIILALPTLFVPAVIALNQTSIIQTLIRSILLLKQHIIKTVLFLLTLGVAVFAIFMLTIESGLLQSAAAEVSGLTLWFEILAIYSIKDIFIAKTANA